MLTYGDIPLFIPDEPGEVNAWLSRYLSLADRADAKPKPPSLAGIRQARPRFETDKGLGIPVINWPAAPPPRINSIYWPSGATRWARGYFLADKKTKDDIVAKVHSSNGNQTAKLKWGDDATEGAPAPLETDMYLLPPQPITSKDADTESLWLLTLVDVRYWWQFTSVEDLEVTTSTTWANLFQTLGTRLDETVNLVSGSVASAYLRPDPVDFTRRYSNAALLLDAAAASIGRRLIRKLDGTVVVESNDVAAPAISQALQGDFTLSCGYLFDDSKGDLPEKVVVTFRRIRHHLLRSNGQVYAKEQNAPSGKITTSGKKLVIQSAAYANYNAAGALTNGTTLDSLAEKIRDDYFAWRNKRYDMTFVGAYDWPINGYDDCVIWDFGRQVAGGSGGVEWLAQARVQSLPANVFAELNLCQDSENAKAKVVEPRHLAKADEDVDSGTSGRFKLYKSAGGNGGDEADTGLTVEAFNDGEDIRKADDELYWLLGVEDALWYVLQPGSSAEGGRPGIEFTLDEDMGATTLQQASATVTASWGEDKPDIGATVIIHDDQDQYTDAIAGCKGMAIDVRVNPEAYWEVQRCQRIAEWGFGRLTENWDGTATLLNPAPIGEIEFHTAGENSFDAPAGEYVIANFLNHAGTGGGSLGDYVVFQRVYRNKTEVFEGEAVKWLYEVRDVQLHDVLIPTEFRMKDDGSGLQWKRKKIRVEDFGHEGDWSDAGGFPFVDVTVVAGSAYDTGTKSIVNTLKTLKVLGSEDAGTVNAMTFVVQPVVISVNVDGLTFEYTTLDVYVAEIGDTTDEDFHTGTPCSV